MLKLNVKSMKYFYNIYYMSKEYIFIMFMFIIYINIFHIFVCTHKINVLL